jgi:transcription-repair coupling factor (superfamily II helicase)
MLGAGFKIAMRDLEIRGAGNILGAEQIRAHRGRRLRDVLPPARRRRAWPQERAGTIPKAYIPSDARRLEAYRRIAVSATQAELTKVREDLHAAYGEWPRAAERLFELAALGIEAAHFGVKSIVRREQDVILRCAAFKDLAQRLEGAGAPCGHAACRGDEPVARRADHRAPAQVR